MSSTVDMASLRDKGYLSWRKRIYAKSQALGLPREKVKKLLSHTFLQITTNLTAEDDFNLQQQRWLCDKLVWEKLCTFPRPTKSQLYFNIH